jgi:hypothetical protein
LLRSFTQYPADSGNELFTVLAHLSYRRGGRFSFFVAGAPKDHFDQHWRQVNAFWSQLVDRFSTIRRIRQLENDSGSFEPLEAL